VGEDGRQAGVVVAGRVGVVREELLGGAKLGLGSRGSGNSRGGAHSGRGLGGGLWLLAPSRGGSSSGRDMAPSRGGSSSGRDRLGVARWCTWAIVFNVSSA
jgi:hypothetical protein